MRTTLVIDDDVLTAAKAIATRRKTSLGKVISDLVRLSLKRVSAQRNGVPLLARTGKTKVMLRTVNSLRDRLS